MAKIEGDLANAISIFLLKLCSLLLYLLLICLHFYRNFNLLIEAMFSATISTIPILHIVNKNFNLLIEAMFSATRISSIRVARIGFISIFLLKLCSLLHFLRFEYNHFTISISIFLLKLCSLLLGCALVDTTENVKQFQSSY